MALRSDELEGAARIFHSLANETRLGIMTLLAEGEMNVTALCKGLRLSETNVSGHLRLLRDAGLVVNRREGRHIIYSHADLSKHRLWRKSELSVKGGNVAKFGPAELFLPKK